MDDIVVAVLFLLFCLGLPTALVVALIVWLVRRGQASAAPAAAPSPTALLDGLELRLAGWQAAGELSAAAADELRGLLARERASAAPGAPAVGTPQPAPAVAPATLPTPAAAPAPAAQPALGERLGGALLALRTRQTLLFLGAFLLVASAFILIVFNWASFSPILQVALLGGVCAGFWAMGAWLIRQTELDRAGAGLQAVGGLLVPVVAFSLSRPGLLDLAARDGWLLASALSLPIYALAAWRLRRVIFAVAGCISLVSAVLAALGMLEARWLAPVAIVTLMPFLPLAGWLARRVPELAAGPRWVAHAGVPLAVAAGALLALGGGTAPHYDALAATLWAAAGFYLLALVLPVGSRQSAANSEAAKEPMPTVVASGGPTADQVPTATPLPGSRWAWQRAHWAWPAALLPIPALLASLAALAPGEPWWGVVPALLALGYLGLALALAPRFARQVLPLPIGALALALPALLAMDVSATTARSGLPLLALGALALAPAYHRGRLAWLAAPNRLLAAVFGLAAAAMLVAVWALVVLLLLPLSEAQRWLLLLPLAALYLLGAAYWPGRLRPGYDYALQIVGGGLALLAATPALGERAMQTGALATLAGLALFQALRRRHWAWATAALGGALITGLAWLGNTDPYPPLMWWATLLCGFTAVYLLCGGLIDQPGRRFWRWPAAGWGALAAGGALFVTFLSMFDIERPLAWQVLAVLALAAIIALASAAWRAAWPGFVAALLLALATLLAAGAGFFSGWRLAAPDYGYVLCAITLGLMLLGQALRLRWPRFAPPYEVVGIALLTLAPLPAYGADARPATLIWAGMLALYALAAWRYRQAWFLAPALLALDMAMLNGAGWLLPAGRPAGAGTILLIAAWLQGLLGLWHTRRVQSAVGNVQSAGGSEQAAIRALPARPGAQSVSAYLVAAISGLGALVFAASAADVLALVAGGLALLAGLLGSLHRRAAAAWGALALLALALGALHHFLAIEPLWSMAWGVAEALGLCLVGWAAEPRTKNREPDAPEREAATIRTIWYQPLWLGPLLLGSGLAIGLALAAPALGQLPPLTLGLALLALLLATLAVRRRAGLYAYAAGAALIAAGLCQIYDWGFRQPQWFVIPAGLYLLALAEGLRRFQGRRMAAQLIESGALLLMLGVSLGQSLRAAGLESQLYAAWLCVESLLLLGYGVLRKLRAPFVGGAAFFVAGVLWLSVDPLLALNKWVLLGALGLLLVGAYVLLERRQQQLARAGRALIERVSSWG